MYFSIKGIISKAGPMQVCVDNSGIGYLITVVPDVSEKAGQEVTVYTHMVVTEDAHTLYGFLTVEDREMFILLTSVTGVGGKTALTILSKHSSTEVAALISANNEAELSKVKGIGPKTVKQIILSLQDKVKKGEVAVQSTPKLSKAVLDEAVQALTALGYKKAEATKLAEAYCSPEDTVETLIKKSLKGGG